MTQLTMVAAGSIIDDVTLIQYDAEWFDFGAESAMDGATENTVIAIVKFEGGDLESALAGYRSAPVHLADEPVPYTDVDYVDSLADEMYDAATMWMN